MRIGIIVAMGKELQLLQHIISNKKNANVAACKFIAEKLAITKYMQCNAASEKSMLQ